MNNHVAAHGTYLLLLECDKQAELSIGKFGKMYTEPGYYLYVGSAFGPWRYTGEGKSSCTDCLAPSLAYRLPACRRRTYGCMVRL